jgi:GNAT superfamily N-acetyltransferase
LYVGDVAVERTHLAAFAASPDAALVVAFAGVTPVGCSTCLPLAQEKANVRAPFEARGWDVARFCYFGESVLLREYRGQGAGVAFFAARETHAHTLAGCDCTTFCAVRRSLDDARRPADAVPLDTFWQRRGYGRLAGVSCTMRWPEVGGVGSQPHELDFWAKSLAGAPLP